MSTVDEVAEGLVVHAKGAPEALLGRCTSMRQGDELVPLDDAGRDEVGRVVDAAAAQGRRVLAVARRALPAGASAPERREDAEADLTLLGLVAMVDPPRASVADAVARCHRAGVRIIVVTGDHGLTATAVARSVGIVSGDPTVVTGEDVDHLDEPALDRLLAAPTS